MFVAPFFLRLAPHMLIAYTTARDTILDYVELDCRGVELLFQVLTEREEKNSVAIASNESFSGWTKTFTDPRLCVAIADRLTSGGNIIETGTDSYRLAITRARAEHQAAS
ncbi:hypothetical protein GCM10010266_74700 [Streptomyces griseomycini]|nr:hypothetical protein GCM10010266_74700 [Streptomyces griseomycini]